MSQGYTVVTYRDEPLADKSVRRSYSNGTYEWRRRLADGRVEWQDSQGNSGIDELLGNGVVKRTLADGRVIYGREQGYGRTAWGGGSTMLTVNQSSFGGRVGSILAGIGAGALLGSVLAAPDYLSAAEEEALRQQAQRNDPSTGSGGDIGSSADNRDWGDGNDGDGGFGDGIGGGGGNWGDSDSDFG